MEVSCLSSHDSRLNVTCLELIRNRDHRIFYLLCIYNSLNLLKAYILSNYSNQCAKSELMYTFTSSAKCCFNWLNTQALCVYTWLVII